MVRFTDNEYIRWSSKFEIVSECWEWKGYLNRDGYGSFYFRRKNRGAHRVSYWAHKGDIPAGLVINHTCRNRKCVNPAHLEAVSLTENALKDTVSVAAMNAQKTECPRGHRYDRKYGKQRYCSICESAKKRRLRIKWASEDDICA